MAIGAAGSAVACPQANKLFCAGQQQAADCLDAQLIG
jgi:hypothetical protein